MKHLTRFLLLIKRLFKRPSFIFMLLMVPVFVLLLRGQGTDDGTKLLDIGVYIEDNADSDALKLMDSLLESDSSFKFREFDSKDDMLDRLKKSEIYEAVVIPADFSDTLNRLVSYKNIDNPIEIYIREQGVSHKLIREVINSNIFPQMALKTTEKFLRDVEGINISESELQTMFEANYPDVQLFVMVYADGTIASEEFDLILMPLRGILAVWLVICVLAASMYFIKDERNGLFIWISGGIKLSQKILYYLAVMLPAALAYFIAIGVSSLMVNVLREIGMLVLYVAALIALSNVVRILCRNIKNIGIMIPLFAILSLVFSPVFIDVKFEAINVCLPSYYYLKSVHNNSYIIELMIYIVVVFAIWIGLEMLKQRRKGKE